MPTLYPQMSSGGSNIFYLRNKATQGAQFRYTQITLAYIALTL
jgi:hypothetical protein